MINIWKIVATILMALYPLLIFFGLSYFEPKHLALFLCLVIIFRFFSYRAKGTKKEEVRHSDNDGKVRVIAFVLSFSLLLVTIYMNSLTTLMLYPVIVNFSLLVIFTISLYYPPTIIERFAKLGKKKLALRDIAYTRVITQIWIVFFTLNGVAAFYTAVFTSVKTWTLYNGLIAYLLIGLLFSSEYIYRKFWFENKV